MLEQHDTLTSSTQKWMRVDFREERRWKYMLAFNLSTAVLEWHEAGSREGRVRQGICANWKRPRPSIGHCSTSNDMDLDRRLPDRGRDNEYILTGDESDNEDEEVEAEQRDIVDPLETGKALVEALEGQGSNGSSDSSQRQSPGADAVYPKVEEVEDSSALRSDNGAGDAMAVDNHSDDNHTQKHEIEAVSIQGLKSSSTDPVFGLPSNLHHGASQPYSSGKAMAKLNAYAPLRERIAYSDGRKLFVEDDDLGLLAAFAGLSTETKAREPTSPPPDLTDIFPGLQPLEMPDIITTAYEGKKKPDKKSEREENKRVDDSGYTKMAPMGKFMLCKPTLLGPIQPVKRWKNGRWLNPEEPAVTEVEATGKISDEYVSGESSHYITLVASLRFLTRNL